MKEQFKDLEKYRENVAFLADAEYDFRFHNTSEKHAAVVLGNILRTTNDVVIYDTDLRGDIAYQDSEFQNLLREFLQNEDKKIKIIIRESLPKSDVRMKFINFIEEFNTKNVAQVFIANQDFKDAMKKFASTINKVDINFAIGDARAVRLENLIDESRYRAECNFNDVPMASALNKIVDENIKFTQAI